MIAPRTVIFPKHRAEPGLQDLVRHANAERGGHGADQIFPTPPSTTIMKQSTM
jgi:hypothetical protein